MVHQDGKNREAVEGDALLEYEVLELERRAAVDFDPRKVRPEDVVEEVLAQRLDGLGDAGDEERRAVLLGTNVAQGSELPDVVHVGMRGEDQLDSALLGDRQGRRDGSGVEPLAAPLFTTLEAYHGVVGVRAQPLP